MSESLDGSMGFADGVIPMVETIEDEENDTSEGSSPEQNEKKENAPKSGDDKDKSSKKSDKDEKDPPFHKHPRWQRMKQDLIEKDKIIQSLTGKVDSVLNKFQEMELNTKMNNPDQWFVQTYGYDIPLWQQYLRDAKIPDQFKPKEEATNYDEKFWSKEFDKQIDNLSDSHNIDFDSKNGKALKEEFMTFLLDNDVTRFDPKFNKEVYDFEKGWKTFVKFKNSQRKAAPNRNKEIASMSKSGSRAGTMSKKGIPIEDIRKMSYKDFYENFSDSE